MGRSISRNGTCPTLLPAHTIDVPWGREEAGSLKEVPKFTVPKIMAPPSLRMPPAFTRPVPFESTEARKRREEMEKRMVRTVERPTPEEKKEKGLLVKLRKWI